MASVSSEKNFDASYGLPEKQGLYDPRFEKDACGVGFVVNIDGIRSQQVRNGLINLLYSAEIMILNECGSIFSL